MDETRNPGLPMTWKRGFFLLLALLIASNAAWTYRVIDHGVTQTYADEENARIRQDAAVLQQLLPQRPATRAEVLAGLRRARPDALIVSDGSGVSMGTLRFAFEGDTLMRAWMEP